MNSYSIDSAWNQVKGKLRQRYGQLTDDDLQFAEGKGEEMLGRVQRKLGLGAEAFHSMLNDMRDSASSAPDDANGAVGAAKEKLAAAKSKATEVAGNVKDKAVEVAGTVKEKAGEVATAVREKVSAFTDDLREQAGESYEQARERAKTLHGDAEEYVRQKPRESLLVALAAGFVVGLLLRR